MSLYTDSLEGVRDWFSGRLVGNYQPELRKQSTKPNIPASFLCGLGPEGTLPTRNHTTCRRQYHHDPHQPQYLD